MKTIVYNSNSLIRDFLNLLKYKLKFKIKPEDIINSLLYSKIINKINDVNNEEEIDIMLHNEIYNNLIAKRITLEGESSFKEIENYKEDITNNYYLKFYYNYIANEIVTLLLNNHMVKLKKIFNFLYELSDNKYIYTKIGQEELILKEKQCLL